MLQMEQVTIRPKAPRKETAFRRTQEYFHDYKKFLVVDLTKMSSRQMQLIRSDLAAKNAVVLMGKNTTIRLALKKYKENNPGLEDVDSVVKNNVAFIFTNGSLSEIEDVFEARKVFSVAKPGDLSQCDLWIDSIQTSLDPGKTSFFHALGIVTKITKGKIEILSKCQALHKNKRVGHSEAALLSLLNITPFVYKMKALYAYSEGKFFDVSYLGITMDSVENMIKDTIGSLSAMALGASYATEATVEMELSHSIRELLAIGAASGYEQS
ncbi:large subunit ribosomal protein LP0 [Nematocida sp. LUAm3]|nr:large subunit ribosomal protein LP0 [Nematocida sp. LUAm3]KAI5175396.1 large subunit ribosomal protein LP0 [Nematocida sp. LUAm2]KAI5177647.1 large subunit ribosomal protein LP0 [Nematocida sp. LUAm1]